MPIVKYIKKIKRKIRHVEGNTKEQITKIGIKMDNPYQKMKISSDIREYMKIMRLLTSTCLCQSDNGENACEHMTF